MSIDAVRLKLILSLTEALIVEPKALGASTPIRTDYPKTFEWLGQGKGFVLYETILKRRFKDPSILSVGDVGDRAYVMISGKPAGILSRANSATNLPITVRYGEI